MLNLNFSFSTFIQLILQSQKLNLCEIGCKGFKVTSNNQNKSSINIQ